MARARSTAGGALAPYRAKRDFAKTPEPQGGGGTAPAGLFVVQKHAARRLHYDFRLALDGVLKSWAVAKGPSLDPAVRRLAVHVEDHPLAYAGFEGVIPQGEYGGGSVMVWDTGTWEPVGDARAGLAKGHLRFRLDGEKLKGEWTLVRMGGRAASDGDNWLLVKRPDDHARPGDGDALLAAADRSVATGRSLEEIAAAADRVWTSRPKATSPAPARRDPRPRGKRANASASLPDFVAPALPTLVARVPAGPEWLHEIKLDGYRVLCRVADRRVRFLTRTGQDWTRKFLSLAGALPAGLDDALIDGEIVVLDDDGTSSFGRLQEELSAGRDDRLVLFAFDLLFEEGEDLRGLPLVERKARLAMLLGPGAGATGRVRLSEHVEGRGADVLHAACTMALEGIVSKRRQSAYRSGRGEDWVKTRCIARQEFVIGGYAALRNGRGGVGALLIGYYEDEALRYAGKVGTGFTAETRARLEARLATLRREGSPFASAVPAAARRAARWVEPRLVAEIAYTEWTRDGVLRHPSFQGLREDKPAADVTRDRAKSAPAPGTRRLARAPGGVEIAGVALTHPDRVLFAEQGLTKRDLAEYYAAVAARMLPHVRHRPLTLVRCPQGRARACFYQKHPGAAVPDVVKRVEVPESEGTGVQLMIDDLRGLIALVQIGVLEFHVWGARVEALERPDRVVFDLDPDPTVDWPRVVEAARELRARLAGMKLTSFVKTTGGKGLHVVVPIAPVAPWAEVKAFAQSVARAMAQEAPHAYTTNMRKAERKGRIFIDYLRNERGATAVAPYSTRARPGAGVATPIDWRELSASLDPRAFNVRTVPARLSRRRRDPWQEMDALRQALPNGARRRRSGARG